MRFRVLTVILAVIALIITTVNSVLMVFDNFVYTIADLPEGAFSAEYVSPGGDRTLSVYKIENSVGIAVRGEVVYDGKTENIYWEAGVADAQVQWLSNDRILINGNTVIVGVAPYDSRAVNEEVVDLLNRRR